MSVVFIITSNPKALSCPGSLSTGCSGDARTGQPWGRSSTPGQKLWGRRWEEAAAEAPPLTAARTLPQKQPGLLRGQCSDAWALPCAEAGVPPEPSSWLWACRCPFLMPAETADSELQG